MMYNVTYLGKPVYGTDEENCILEPKLDEELNSAGTFTFTVPVENESLWNSIEVFNGEVIIYEEDEVIWFGRPFQIVRDWLNRKVVTCEGALAYFNDIVQATHTYDGIPLYTEAGVQNGKKGFFNTIIDLHNDMVQMDDATDFSRQIFVGNITVDNEPNIYREVDYQTTSEVLQQMCLDTNGGYFILRKAMDPSDGYVKTYIDWVKDMPYGTTQKITFGRNLLDVSQDLNGSDICTVLLAFGSDDKTIAGLNKWTSENDPYSCKDGTDIYHKGKDSEYLIDIQGYKKYGRVLKVKTWNDIVANDASGKEQLFIKAAEWLNDQNTDITTIECNAADLHYIDTDDDNDQGKLRIGQKVTILSPVHDLNAKELPIFKISMSLDSGAKTITMGTPPKRELTDIVKSSGGSTRGSSGTTGGGGGSDSSGGGSGSVNIPVKDVQVKFPGDEKFGTVVKKKVAKIDLSELGGGVSDVRLDNVSKVSSGVANINTSDIVQPNPEGESTGDLVSIKIGQNKYNIPSVSNVVSDVTLDGVSIKDPNDNIAKILSRDIIEGGVEGNFEHVVEKTYNVNVRPSKDIGKKTDILIETDIDDHEVTILTQADTPINLQEIGGWYTYEQDFVAEPTGYYDPYDIDPQTGQPRWKYDPTSPQRVHNVLVCNGDKSGSWYFPTVNHPPGNYKPFDGHMGTANVYGYKINTSGYVDIMFEFHDPNGVKYKPTKVSGIFAFKDFEAGTEVYSEDYGYYPYQESYSGSTIVRLHVSNDGENWTSYDAVSAPESGNGNFIFNIDEYYEYIRMSCTNYLYSPAGYKEFTVKAVPESHIKNIWFKTEDKAWIKQHVPKIVPNPSDQATDTLSTIDIDGRVYEFNANAPVQDVYLDGSSVLDANGIAQLTSPTIPVTDVTLDGSSVVNNGVAELTSPTIPVQDVKVDGSSVVDGNGDANITIPVTDVTLDGSSVVSNGVAALSSPNIPVQDVLVDGYSVLDAYGNAQIQMPVIPTVPVQDVLVDGYSVVDANGNAQIQMPVIPSVPVQDVYLDGYSVLDANGIAQLSSPNIPVTDVELDGQSVVSNGVASLTSPTIPVTDVEVNGSSVLNNGVAEITIPQVTYPVNDVEVDGQSVVNQNGVAEITMPTIPVTDVELDGISVVSNGVASLTSPTIPVTDVEVDGVSVVSNGVASITSPTIPVTDVEVNGTSVVSQGVAEINASVVEANPSSGTSVGDLTSIEIDGTKYDIPSGGGGGTTVVPNPVGQPTEDLDTVQIGNTIFDIPAGTNVVANPQTQPTERLNTIQIGNSTYRVAEGSGGETIVDFNYTGSIQTFTAPKAGDYILEVWGAQGGQANESVHGGYGGYSVGTVTLAQGDTIYICVGGKGGGNYTQDTSVVGYNGGGEANYGGDRGNGGGATHIATRTGLLYTLSSHQSDILIVAGGGGGSGYYPGDECDGGSGGGYIGGTGETYDSNSHPGTGGTQLAGGETDDYSGQSHGSFGQGASRDDGDLWGGSGGGGGFYGGGASTNNAGAGGGSGYINTTELTDAAMYGYSVLESSATATKTFSVNAHSSDAIPQYAKEGNGHARITYNEGDFDPYVTVGDLYDACVANGVTPASQTLTAIIAAILSN